MKNPLTPQLRADRNGKMVTRHIKAGAVLPVAATKVPPPFVSAAIKQAYAVPERDVKRPRRSATTVSGRAEAKKIRDFFGVPSTADASGSVNMSDNEILDYMQEGFTATSAVEFKRWGISVETALMSTVGRLPVKETVRRMRSLDLSPDEATRIIRNGMMDRHLDKYLSDNELFNLLREEKMNSHKYAERAKGVSALVNGDNTREEYRELGFENLGKYGGYLRIARESGTPLDYSVFRKAIERAEEPYRTIPKLRYNEGWTQSDSRMGIHQLLSLVKKFGPEVLEVRHLGVFRMMTRFGETIEGYRYMDEFFTLAGDEPLRINPAQRKEMETWENRGWNIADFTEGLRHAGLTPEQAYLSINNGLTLEKAKEVHLNRQSTALIEGWL